MAHSSELIANDIGAYLKVHENKDMLRFLTCGSVDDGKSTLIGRLLYDSKMIFEDQMAAIENDSKRFNTTGEDFDLALLVDGLQSEREQGITIDVAYRYFSTENRKFIIADTPGHEQYTRNMATGASTCDLAVILIDARHGVQTQTRRHSFITSLLGIKQVVVAINKMDLVDFSEQRFNEIVCEYQAFAQQLDYDVVHFVPLSALNGDNVVNASSSTPWYKGETLMHLLDNVEIDPSAKSFDQFRLPIQYVNRPNLDFRGFCGTVAAGSVEVGDTVISLPSGVESKVKSIVAFEGELAAAHKGMAITLTLDDEIDSSRGDMFVKPQQRPKSASHFEANIVWMGEQSLQPHREYVIKVGARQTVGRVSAIDYRVDVNTMERIEAPQELALNDIAHVQVDLETHVQFDLYDENRETGAFIVIDRLTNNTVGAGMISGIGGATNVVWHATNVTKQQRSARKNQKPAVLWFTGLSGSGKSTIANAVESLLFKRGYHSYLLDGDNVRHGLSNDLGFADADRIENIRRVAHVSSLFTDAGLIVLTAFISPFEKDRELAKDVIGDTEFIEVYVNTPIEVCEQRDPKGLYKKARGGEIDHFTGISSPYEAPQNPSLEIDAANTSVQMAAEAVVEFLTESGYLT